MQTHRDSDGDYEILQELSRSHEAEQMRQQAMRSLEKRAADMVARGESKITAGKPDEEILDQRERFGVEIVRRPDDLDCLRISIGEVAGGGPRYLVFRGKPTAVVPLLERAARALRAAYD